MTSGLGGKTGAHEGRSYEGMCKRAGMGPRIREDNGWEGLLRRRDSSTPLRCAQNDMWVRGKTGAHEGRPYEGMCKRAGMGPRIREDTGGRVCYDDEILHSAALRSE